MIDLILNRNIFLGLLIALAIITPLAGYLVSRKRPQCRGRELMAWSAFGPVALLFWGWHNAVLAMLGFDSVWSLFVILASGIAIGCAAGIWIRRG